MAEAHHDGLTRQFHRDAAAEAASGVCTHVLAHALPASTGITLLDCRYSQLLARLRGLGLHGNVAGSAFYELRRTAIRAGCALHYAFSQKDRQSDRGVAPRTHRARSAAPTRDSRSVSVEAGKFL
jgi:hypothetical protein